MAFAFVGSTTVAIGTAASTWSIGFALSSAQGAVIAAGAGSSANTISTVTDNAGNVYLRAVENSTTGGNAAHAALWYCPRLTAASTRVEVTWAANSSGALALGVWTGFSTYASVLDQTASSLTTANSTSWSAAPITPTYGNSLVVMADRLIASTIGAANVSAGFTWLSTVARTYFQYQIQGASSATEAPWTTSSRSGGHAAVIAAFMSDTVVLPVGGGWASLTLMGVQ